MDGMGELRIMAQALRQQAQGRMRADRWRLWPHVADVDFDAVVNALGEVSIIEAREALARMELEAKLRL